MSYWDTPPVDRRQIVLFAPTLESVIAEDHPVRLFDEVLRELDWREWENHYCGVAGQPAIPPRIVASVILYGLSLGLRSSRKLQDACGNRLDFVWLTDGREIDHSTICKFRTRFSGELKGLFRQVGRVAMGMGLIRLNQVSIDGTKVLAHNGRYNTGRTMDVEKALAELDKQVNRMLEEAEQADRAENSMFGEDATPAKLPRQLADLKTRQKKMNEALQTLRAMQEKRGDRKDVSKKGPQIPLADIDSRVLPNKSGGYAPNYVPVLAADGQSGFLLDADLAEGNDEASTLLGAVDRIKENFGASPAQALADSGFHTGPNLAGLENRGVEALVPAQRRFDDNPAVDPSRLNPAPVTQELAQQSESLQQTQPIQRCQGNASGTIPAVPPEQWDKLPVNPQQKVLDKAAFIYDAAADRYHCPMGRTLEFVRTTGYQRESSAGTYRVYECGSCTGCPLAIRCLQGRTKARRIMRDEYDDVRERAAERIKAESGREAYRKRWPLAETPFGILKAVMNFRQFLLRGRDKVRIEWNWAATAYNLRKLSRAVAEKRCLRTVVSPG
jgi:transposase